MPWKECNAMDERLKFVARLLDGEEMAVMCREFGIYRKTGCKTFNGYKGFGIRGLPDRAVWDGYQENRNRPAGISAGRFGNCG